MTARFADTFYWIALTLPQDAAYARAQQVTDDVVTTEEVLTEYLTFFAGYPEHVRREVTANVEAMLNVPGIRIIPQSHESFMIKGKLDRSFSSLVPRELLLMRGGERTAMGYRPMWFFIAANPTNGFSYLYTGIL